VTLNELPTVTSIARERLVLERLVAAQSPLRGLAPGVSVKMTRWLVRLLSQEAGKWSGTSINSGIYTVGQ
jgi:hypothetical protein